jgi:energy-coupling factor transport system permease protein
MADVPDGRRSVRRLVHAGAWWAWALLLAAAASRTTNILLLALIIAATAVVVSARAGHTPWARAYPAALRLGAWVIAIRLIFQLLFGAPIGATVILTLPSLPLPEWAAGVRVGGEVTLESMVAGLYDGVRLATMIICVGAANALTGPTRLLRSVPGALYEAGVAIVVTLSLAPSLVMDAQRVRQARRLRGRPTSGARGMAGLVGPVLDGALRRSLDLAAAMDSRGYGRTGHLAARHRRISSLALLGGLVGFGVGTYGLLDGSAPPLLGLPMLLLGACLAVAGLRVGGRRTRRTRYRRDPWARAEWAVLACGTATAVAFWVLRATQPDVADPSVVPLAWPALPLLGIIGAAFAALPAVVTPAPEDDDGERARAEAARPAVTGVVP